MLVEFAVDNYKSFSSLQRLQLEAANITSSNKRLDEENVFPAKKIHLLKAKAIYGENGSGKSNLIRAFAAFWKILQNSFAKEGTLEFFVSPNRIFDELNEKPSFFQLIFIIDDIQYRYGFEATKHKICSEWLFAKKKKEVPYFLRNENEIEYFNENSFSEIKPVLKKGDANQLYRDNSLIIPLLSALNASISSKIRRHIISEISIYFGTTDHQIGLIKSLEDNVFRSRLIEFISGIDRNITDIYKKKSYDVTTNNNKEEKGTFVNVVVVKEFENNQKKIEIDLATEEAEGTKKLIYLTPVIFHRLDSGGTLVLDEFDSRFHPLLAKKIIQLFNSKSTNPNNAQLVIVTHNTSLLSAGILRRDQVVFVEKNSRGESQLVELVEFKEQSKKQFFEKDYLNGAYGAIPYLNQIDNAFLEPA